MGIVMLDTRFPRPPGDIGHPQTFAVPVRRLVVPGAWPAEVVQSGERLRTSGLVPRFVAAARQLVHAGAAAITTSCGFLVLLQEEMQAAVPVPLVTSSLTLLPGLLRTQARAGVLTINAQRLGSEHLRCAGVPADRLADVVVQGVAPESAFARAILGNQPAMDLAQASADVVAAAVALQTRAPDVRTLVLECTNMPPYLRAIEQATGLQVLWLRDCHALFEPFGISA